MKYTKVELLEQAQVLLEASIDLIQAATRGDANVKAYLIDQLKVHSSSAHGFLSNDLNLDEVIEKYSDNKERKEYDDMIQELMNIEL